MKHVLWTSGFDSTYVVMKYLLEGETVQPIYFSQVDKRNSQKIEEKAIGELTSLIRSSFPELANSLLDTQFVVIECTAEIDKKLSDLGGHGKSFRYPIGTQTAMMAHFCQYFPEPIYLGVEHAESSIREGEMSRTHKFFFKYLSFDANGCGYIDETKLLTEKEKLLTIYKNLRFPVIKMTKQDMYDDSKDKNFKHILDETWSCWYPHRPSNLGKGCGRCFACKGRIIPSGKYKK